MTCSLTASRPVLPWELAQSLYQHVITIKRPNTTITGGLHAYQGITEADESVIVSGIAANIDIAGIGKTKSAGNLPSDSAGPVRWTITVPASPALPLIIEGDVVYDDLGRRFQVAAYEPTPLGATIETVRMLE